MGRGLSDLQKTILRLALARHEKLGEEDRVIWQGDFEPAEVLADHFGWEPSTFHDRKDGLRVGIKFYPDEIGAGPNNAARASLSRAASRLASRGLLERGENSRGWLGDYFLTDLGISYARVLSVKEVSGEGNLTDSQVEEMTNEG